MVAIGVTFIIIMGSIDLSMEGNVSVSAVIFAFAFIALGGTLASWAWLAIPLALIVGAVMGFINGLVHVKLKIPSFMASLAMGFVGTGFALADDRRRPHPGRGRAFPVAPDRALVQLPDHVLRRAAGPAGRVVHPVAHDAGPQLLRRRRGRGTGRSQRPERRRVRILGFTLAGVFFALGALMAVGRIGIAETATGNNFMFISITAVVVGGTALWGGIGGVWNTLVGVLIVNVINNGMVVIGLPNWLQDGVLGILVIIAVVLSTNRKSISFVK